MKWLTHGLLALVLGLSNTVQAHQAQNLGEINNPSITFSDLKTRTKPTQEARFTVYLIARPATGYSFDGLPNLDSILRGTVGHAFVVIEKFDSQASEFKTFGVWTNHGAVVNHPTDVLDFTSYKKDQPEGWKVYKQPVDSTNYTIVRAEFDRNLTDYYQEKYAHYNLFKGNCAHFASEFYGYLTLHYINPLSEISFELRGETKEGRIKIASPGKLIFHSR